MSENGDKVEFDAGQQHLGDVYAKALLAAAEKANASDEVIEQFESVVKDVLNKLPKFEAALSSPRVPDEEKVRMLDSVFSGKMHLTLLNFLKVVSAHDRMNCLREMYRAARRQLNEMRGRVEVRVATAVEVDSQTTSSLAERLSAALSREVDLQTSVDPELLGGLVVRVGDTVYDGSVANRLSRMREQTLHNTIQTIRNSLERFSND